MSFLIGTKKQEIERAVRLYREVCKNPGNLSYVDTEIIPEVVKAEFFGDFARLGRLEDRVKKAKEELEIFDRLKSIFASYVSNKLLSGINLEVNLMHESHIALGRSIIDYELMESPLT